MSDELSREEFIRRIKSVDDWTHDELIYHNDAILTDRDAWRRALTECTPMGSDFTLPRECGEYVLERERSLHHRVVGSVKERNDAVQRAERAEAQVRRLGEVIERAKDKLFGYKHPNMMIALEILRKAFATPE